MRLVTYSKDSYYFLTDTQFAAAMEGWNASKSVWVESIEALLPPPRFATGLPAEHLGLQIGYSWNKGVAIPFLPGWIAIKRPVMIDGDEKVRGAVFWRASTLGEAESYYWKEINIHTPTKLTVSENTTSDEVKKFINAIGFTPIDQLLEDPELRHAVSYAPLLSEYLLSRRSP